ncbi:MAG: hypothetical protein EZS28_039942 [Streblomastix strix]|uniref:Uncharacterized protein n=1 Tax=Streblomastix strix TaxID=222440 RepID=A0A5J4U3E9_9EUKA|nr:MAG: hypothetical protein EZS28_039942 [Streblomastix strix]
MEQELLKARDELYKEKESKEEDKSMKQAKILSLSYELDLAKGQLDLRINENQRKDQELLETKQELRKIRTDYAANCEKQRLMDSQFGNATDEADKLRLEMNMMKKLIDSQEQQLVELNDIMEKQEIQNQQKIREMTSQLNDSIAMALTRDRRVKELESIIISSQLQ